MTERTAGDEAVIQAAVMLKHAAILNRDIASSLSVRVQSTMPPDISRRLYSPLYEAAFGGLPQHIQDAAMAIVEASDWLAEARLADAGEG
jgi:hypothetical protein